MKTKPVAVQSFHLTITLTSLTVGQGLWGKFTKIKKYEELLNMVKGESVIVLLYFLAQTQQMKMERNKNEKSKQIWIRGK